MKKILFLLIPVVVLFSCASSPEKEPVPENSYKEPVLPETESFVLDDFESENYWYAVKNYWDSAIGPNFSKTAEISRNWKTDNSSLLCSMEPAGEETKSQASWCCDVPLLEDWTGYNFVAFDVKNPETFEYALNFALQGTEKWIWRQTQVILVPEGEHTVLFSLENIEDDILKDVKRIVFQSLNPNPGGFIYFDNLRLYK